MKKIFILLIVIFTNYQIYSQIRLKNYDPKLDSLMLNFGEAWDNDSTFVFINNRIKYNLLFDKNQVKYLYLEPTKINKTENLNKYPNIEFLSLWTNKESVFSDEISISKLKFVYLFGRFYYDRIPSFVLKQKDLLGINIMISDVETCINEVASLKNSLTFLAINSNDSTIKEIPIEVVKLEKMADFTIMLESNKILDLPLGFHKLSNLSCLRLPIDLATSYKELEKISNLMALSVDTCSNCDFHDLNKLMSNLITLEIENISKKDLEKLTKLYPEVRINKSLEPVTRKEGYERGVITKL